MSIDRRFVRAVRADDSAVAPSADSPLSLQEEARAVAGSAMQLLCPWGLSWAETTRTGRDADGGIGRNKRSHKYEAQHSAGCLVVVSPTDAQIRDSLTADPLQPAQQRGYQTD